jgi:homoaconitase/3-isopropylmalate dehydratase large subunit
MSKVKKLLRQKEMEEEAADLIKTTLTITKIHLDNLLKKAQEGMLTPQESFTLCSYLKTLSYVEKVQKQTKVDFAKTLTKMSDAEFDEELKKNAKDLKGIIDELADDA